MEVLPRRETWRGKFDFVFSLIGFSVGYGNLWRFPYLCYKNGGGSFIFPYIFSLVLVALPMLILEVALGQLMQSGPITAWNIIPLFQGVGYASTVIGFWSSLCYSIILAWNLYYLFASFTSVLPWSSCGNSWNTELCRDFYRGNSNFTLLVNDTSMGLSERSLQKATASHEYWDHKVLHLSAGLDEPGLVRWDITLCLLLAWILCYLCVWRGTVTTGKVVYFTACAPYFLMAVLIIRAMTLDGAMDGLLYLVNIDWQRLEHGEVWLDAVSQVLFSCSVGIGTMTSLGSRSKFHANTYRDCIIFAVVNSATSILGGILIFALLGFLAKEAGVSIASAAESGPELVFVAIPAAVSRIPIAALWAILFFAMIFLLGVDSEFVAIQGFVTAIVDLHPTFFSKRFRKEFFTAITCTVGFLCSLSLATEGGIYVFTLLDAFSAGGPMLFIVIFFQSIAVAWFYGTENFFEDITAMQGFRVFRWIKACWKYIIPITCMAMVIYSFLAHPGLVFDGTYHYPTWAWGIGVLVTLSFLLCVPVVALVKTIRTDGTIPERLRKLTTPNNLHKFQEERIQLHKVAGKSRDRLLKTNA